MKILGQYVWGKIAISAWSKHMLREMIPRAKELGHSREEFRGAMMVAMDKHLESVWKKEGVTDAQK